MRKVHFRLAMWAQMPGRDFEKPWAEWLIGSNLPFTLWIKMVEEPLVRSYCWIWGHIVRVDGRGWFCACCLGGSRSEPPPVFHRF